MKELIILSEDFSVVNLHLDEVKELMNSIEKASTSIFKFTERLRLLGWAFEFIEKFELLALNLEDLFLKINQASLAISMNATK